jgi:cyclin B
LPPVEHRAYVHGQSVAGVRAVGGGVAVNADDSPPAKDVQTCATPRVSVASPFRADAENVRSVAEYVPDVSSLLFREETACTLREGFLDQQADINVKMRSILIDWLTEVHMKYRMKPVTMFLTVNIIDRYLAKAQVARKRLQLVGVVAMFIAAKFEEIRPPQVADFVYITDKAYSKKEITDMECVMLVALSFKIRVPTVPQFLDRLHAAAQCDVVQKEVTFYITELALMDHRSVRHTPSHLAAASMFLSNQLLGCDIPWSVSMVRHSRITETSLSTCVSELRSLLAAAPTGQLKAICKKYSASARQGVAKLPALAVT